MENKKQPSAKPALQKGRKPFEKPKLTNLTSEQAKLKLLGAATAGDPGAKDLLALLFLKDELAQSFTDKKK